MQHGRKPPHKLLEEARIRADLSQQALGDLLGIHQSLVSKLEKARRRPGLTTALKIRAFAGIPVEDWAA